jgi:hypothetical protein
MTTMRFGVPASDIEAGHLKERTAVANRIAGWLGVSIAAVKVYENTWAVQGEWYRDGDELYITTPEDEDDATTFVR